MGTRRRLGVSLFVATLASVAVTTLILASTPGTFFDLEDDEGHSRLIVGPPSPQKLGLLAGIALCLFGVSLVALLRTARFPLVASLLLIASVQAGAYVAFSFWNFHEEPEFCSRTCHVMEPLVQTLESPADNRMMLAHATNDTVLCLDCHSGPGLAGQAQLMKTSLRHLWVATVSRSFDPEHLGKGDPLHTVPDAFCTKCHSDTGVSPLPPEHETQQEKCALCHNPHAREGGGTHVPVEAFTAEACEGCHENATTRLQVSPARHKDLADGDCRACHAGSHVNFTEVPSAVPGCAGAKCHDDDPANNASLAVLQHASFNGTALCADCHGEAHDLKPPPQDLLDERCAECHVEGARPFVETPSGHARLSDDEGCTACHGPHSDPPSAPPSCESSGCHDSQGPADALPALPHPALKGTDCADCHGGAHNLTAPTMDALEPSCASCHVQATQRLDDSRTGHALVASGPDGCTACHKSHDPPPPTACTDSSCHDQDRLNPDSLASLSHPTFAGTASCADCHGSAHDLQPPPQEKLAAECTQCHEDAAASLRAHPSAHTVLIASIGCDACHSDHDDPDANVRSCADARCHASGSTGQTAAPMPHVVPPERPCAECHGTAHELSRPPESVLATACSECHAERAQTMQRSLTGHGDLANREDGCVDCHTSHDPSVTAACADSRCHGGNGNASSGAPRVPHTAFSSDECSDCHGSAHDLRQPEQADLKGGCDSCHSRQAQSLATTGANHSRLAERVGCDACHVEHREGGGPKACTAEGCHAPDAQGPARMPHERLGDNACTDCHGGAHRLQAPTTKLLNPYCATCHSVESASLRASATKHGDLARSGQCSQCHVQHGDTPARGCTDAGCHDNDTSNPASLAVRDHAPTPGGAACADCHGSAHDVKLPPFSQIEPLCAECHVASAARVTYSATGHADIVTAQGCDGCHVTHADPPGNVKACASAGCHDQDPGNAASLVVKQHAPIDGCLDCHVNGHAPEAPAYNRLAGSCDACHVDAKATMDQSGLGHARVAAEGCDTCHRSHSAWSVPSCRGAGCHDTDASNAASLTALSHKPYANSQNCKTCHGGGHSLKIPDGAELETECTSCHGTHALAANNTHVKKGIIQPGECTKCHASAVRMKAENGLRSDHGKLVCIDCHVEGNTVGAPVPPYTYPSNESQISWLRNNNPEVKPHVGVIWSNTFGDAHRGNHTRGQDCGECHQLHIQNAPAFPTSTSATCGGTACHRWLGDISQSGFRPRTSGSTNTNTSYQGTTNPEALLQVVVDGPPDYDGRTHTDIFLKAGCAGFCHNSAMTMDLAEAYGETGAIPAVDAGTTHGYINKCTDCHRFTPPGAADKRDLHKTHIPFIQGENSNANSGPNAPTQACTYCHSNTIVGVNQSDPPMRGVCYNCHLSGHRPEVFYWAPG